VKDTEQAALALLEATPRILRDLLSGLPESIFTADLDRGWSPKRILAHEVDVEHVFAERLHRMIEEDAPSISSIDPLLTLEAGDLESQPVADLLDQIETQRSESVAWLRTLSDAQLQRTAHHDTLGEFTVSQLIHYWPTHDLAHINGIRRMLVAVLRHEVGGIEEFDI
jgi:hypothetical protein